MRYCVLIAAVLMQMCLGATYSWSVYVQPVREYTGLSQAAAQVPFTVFYFVFPLSMLIAGNMLERIGTSRSAVCGGLLFGCGWLLAGLGGQSFYFTVLGIGVLAGIGAGMAYVVPIAVCIRWFPESRGMVAGVAVAGFGGGAALISQAGGWLMSWAAMTPFAVFVVFGSIFLVMVTGAGMLMLLPDDSEKGPRSVPLQSTVLFAHPCFRLLYVMMVAGLAAGFAVNANLKELYRGGNDAVQIGITAVALFALANGVGRVAWGALFDRVSSSTAIRANLLCQAVTLAIASWLVQSVPGFWAVALLTGFNYGGVLVVYVSTVARIWGAEHVGQVYGWLFSANIPAAMAPIVAGLIYDRTGRFDTALLLSAALLAAAGLLPRRGMAAIDSSTGYRSAPSGKTKSLSAA